MAKRAYFAFHYQDVCDFRENVVRNHWMTKPHREAAGFFDASLWEDAKKHGDIAIKRLINAGIEGTSTTCVLIGSHTYNRRWVSYEIMRSFKRGNSILAVHINSIAGKDKKTKPLGPQSASLFGSDIHRQRTHDNPSRRNRRKMGGVHRYGRLRIVPDRRRLTKILRQRISCRSIAFNA